MKKRILIVEDDVASQYVLTQALIELNLEVITAGTGREAISILSSDPNFHLIVTDIIMPELDGIALREHQLTRPELEKIPVIFLTGHLAEVQRAKNLGPHLVLIKPVIPEDFRKIVENVLFEN